MRMENAAEKLTSQVEKSSSAAPTEEDQAAIFGIFEAGTPFVERVAAQAKGRADVLLKNR